MQAMYEHTFHRYKPIESPCTADMRLREGKAAHGVNSYTAVFMC